MVKWFTGYRVIDGKKFKMTSFHPTQREAREFAKNLRRGWYVRVIYLRTKEFTGDYLEGYGVYKSKKPVKKRGKRK